MTINKTLIALAIATAAPTVFAQSAELTITGKIIPGACIVSLGDGGTVDLGNIYARDLNDDEATALDPVALPLNVTCDAPVLFALEGVDNAADSAVDPQSYGLGKTAADEKIGTAAITLVNVTADGEPGFGTQSVDGGATWTAAVDGPAALTTEALHGFADQAGHTNGPVHTTVLQGDLSVLATIQPTNELTIDGDVQVNGSVTLNVTYL